MKKMLFLFAILLAMPVVANAQTDTQRLVVWLKSGQKVYHDLNDEPETVEDCLEVMRARDEETVRASLDSRADGFIFWEDSSTTNISPDLFNRYTAPELNEWGRLLHANGKLLIHHGATMR